MGDVVVKYWPQLLVLCFVVAYIVRIEMNASKVSGKASKGDLETVRADLHKHEGDDKDHNDKVWGELKEVRNSIHSVDKSLAELRGIMLGKKEGSGGS